MIVNTDNGLVTPLDLIIVLFEIGGIRLQIHAVTSNSKVSTFEFFPV